MTEWVEIGNARLACGDCTEIMRELPDRAIDFVFTDPPYGHNNNNGDLIANWEQALGLKAVPKEEWRPIENDGPEANDLFRAAVAEFNRIIVTNGCCCCCCCGGGGPDPQFARWSLWLDELYGFKHMVIWDKGPMGMGWHYRRSYETVLVGQRPNGKCKWHDETDRVENVIRNIPKILPSRDQHPTEKPPALAAKFVGLHSLPGETVLDPFMGSGSTGIAALRMDRRFIGIELDPHWFNVACRRIEEAQRQLPLFQEE